MKSKKSYEVQQPWVEMDTDQHRHPERWIQQSQPQGLWWVGKIVPMYPLLVVRGDYMGSMVVLNFVFFKSLKLYSYIIIDFQFLFTGEHWMLPRI